jgi:hypothetical protein
MANAGRLHFEEQCIQYNYKVKVKQSLYTLGGERRYSSYSFTTSALDGGEWSASRPGRALPPGKGPPVPTVQEAGWAPEPVWTQRLKEKASAPAGDRTPILHCLYGRCAGTIENEQYLEENNAYRNDG